MKRITLAAAVAVALCSAAFAGGAGGVECYVNAGADLLPFLARVDGNDAWLVADSASVIGFGGFGYGVGQRDALIGGFGYAFLSGDMAAPLPEFGMELNSMAGGFGGVVTGMQSRYGSVVASFQARLGAGGYHADYRPIGTDDSFMRGTGSFALYASVDLEAGLLAAPFMLVSVYGGVSGTLAFTGTIPLVMPLVMPVVGVRVAWGSF